MAERFNRRQFMAAGAMGTGAVLLGGRLMPAMAAEDEDWIPKLPAVKIYKVYIGRTGGIYLSRPGDEIKKFDDHLAGVEQRLGDVKFVGGDVVPPADVDAVVAKLKDADGVLLFHLSGHGGGAPRQAMSRIIDVGLPTVVFSQPFSGHGWMYFPRWQKEGKKVVLLPSSDWSELDRIVGLMRVPPHMRRTRILVIRGPLGTPAACSAEEVKQRLGAEMIPITVEETLKAHEAVDIKAAEAEAQRYWIRPAKRIVEPSHDEIVNATRFYLAVRNLMKEHGARAVTSSNCMGAPAKGCLCFSKLCDLGLVGACEGDMDSTLTMLIFQYAFGRPSFISDPVVDTAKSALVHFHCTSATRLVGAQRLPFTIRTQSDSERGVSLEVEYPIGEPVTCAKFVNLDAMLLSTGTIFDVTHDELGCRTQFWTKVADANKMFMDWGGGLLGDDTMTLLHRVVCLGDHAKALGDLGVLMGYRVVQEG